MKVKHAVVAAARVAEAALRGSPRMQAMSRRAVAALARRSSEARAFVRLKLMRLV